jgi:hypothetical protein
VKDMNGKLVDALFSGLASGVIRGVGTAVAGAVVTGVLGAIGIEVDANDLISNSQNDSDTTSDSIGENTEA